MQSHNFKFEDPVQHEITSVGSVYHMQKVTSNGQDVLIGSDWFRSDGFKYGIDKKPEMLFKAGGNMRLYLDYIECEAVRQLKVPVEVLQENGIANDGSVSNENLYRKLYSSQFLYCKLDRDCVIFNSRRDIMKKEDCGYGDYRVILTVKGTYIGRHTQENKLASLHMRIAQIQYRPVNRTCLFDAASCLNRNNLPSPLANSTPNNTPLPKAREQQPQQSQQTPNQPVPQTVPNAPKKGGRRQVKPQLQRQNAMIEIPIQPQQQQQQNLPETYSADFFPDLDI